MKSSEWKESPLIDLCEYISRGVTPAYSDKNGVVVLNQKCIRDNRVSYEQSRFTDPAKKNIPEAKYLQDYDILVNSTGVGTLGRVAQVNKIVEKTTVDSHVTIVRAKENVNPRFLGYNLFLQQANIEALAEGSTGQTELSRARLAEAIKVQVPPILEQNVIAETLLSLDDKINLNNSINKNLDEIAQALFKNWFVDFEPFQDGQFVESDIGKIPAGWSFGVIDEIIELFDSKRIPLSSRKREHMKKVYPYYGATSLMDYVEDYIFDGLYVLLGEDGTVVDSKGYPILQYVWGKFWVNNHAHILKGKNGFNEDSLYMMLKNTNMQCIVTGAVQLKINQANLKSVKVIIPSKEVILNFNHLVEPLFAEKRRALEENLTLMNIRDSILPKLMNGEIQILKEEVQ